MCYQVKCGTCGKLTWAGCGRHVESVHRQIPEGQHCACRGWPSVSAADAGGDKAGNAGGAGGDKVGDAGDGSGDKAGDAGGRGGGDKAGDSGAGEGPSSSYCAIL